MVCAVLYTDNGAVIARSGWLGFTDDHTHRGHMGNSYY